MATAAASLSYAPLQAQTGELWGELQIESGEYAAAVASLQKAARDAEVARDDSVRARAWIELAESAGAKLARVDEGRQDAELAGAILTHLVGRDDLHSLLEATRSDLDVLAGRCDEAIAHAKVGLGLRETLFGPDHPETAAGHRQLGRAYMCGSHFAEARTEMERDLAILEKAYGPDHPAVAVDLDVLAVSEANLGEYEAALASYQRAVQVIERSLGPDNPQIGPRSTTWGTRW